MKKIVLGFFLIICVVVHANWKILNYRNGLKQMKCDMDSKGIMFLGKVLYKGVDFYPMDFIFYEDLQQDEVRIFLEIDDKIFSVNGNVYGDKGLVSAMLSSSEYENDMDILQEMKKGNKLIITIYKLNGEKVERKVTLKGFTKAFNNIGRK